MERIKKGDYVCEKASMQHTYKTYYVVTDIEDENLNLIRCTTEIESSYIYTMPSKSVQKMNRVNILITDNIYKQLLKNKENIDDEYSFNIIVGLNNLTKTLLEGLTDVITFYTSGKEKLYLSFELESVPSALKKNAKCMTITLGRMFHKITAKSKKDWYLDVL